MRISEGITYYGNWVRSVMPSDHPVRDALIQRMMDDLVGPVGGPDEEISDYPTSAYLTGILWPRGSMSEAHEDEGDEPDQADTTGEGAGTGPPIDMRTMHKPHSMGASFRVSGTREIRVSFTGARYERFENEDGGVLWRRRGVSLEKTLKVGRGEHLRDEDLGEDVSLHAWMRGKEGEPLDITIVMMNGRTAKKGPKSEQEGDCLLQCSFHVYIEGDGKFVARPHSNSMRDDDGRVNRLIYRNRRSYASGHGCSVSWSPIEGPDHISGTWLPEVHVPSMDPQGGYAFQEAAAERGLVMSEALSAKELSETKGADRRVRLEIISEGYGKWLREQREVGDGLGLDEEMSATLDSNISRSERILDRIRRGIDLVVDDPQISHAFGLSMEAMSNQSSWGSDGYDLSWRPFQIAFQLMCIPSFSEGGEGIDIESRDEMDLLWFPTGGGKTEAYLGLIALVVLLRRMRALEGGGRTTSVMMRYTLRTLTNQQFQRACKLMIALENVRKSNPSLGNDRFTIGLWVGQSGSPNKVSASRDDKNRDAQVLEACPCCEGDLDWDPLWSNDQSLDIESTPWHIECISEDCASGGGVLPVHVIDECIYNEPPDLLIGTVDKFAQLVRKSETHPLVKDLELIIQDELHLISGPLGSVDGLYEAALDIISSKQGRGPKILGSTATIRRAEEQVRQLYDCQVTQFPPAVLDWSDSCFAVIDEEAPGRVYTGLTSTGRSPKFSLQACYSSLLQSTEDWRISGRFSDQELDPFRTLLGYFNSRREVGGAGILVRDDVRRSMGRISGLRGTSAREIREESIAEVTARMSSDEIPLLIGRIGRKHTDDGSVDVALATNMISVGVDIGRLGLMVVAGQPKAMSEYIQATSRVGRGIKPGLIVTLYNDGRARDRSHYESHVGWLLAPYREVEANSVTPYSPRTRDRALAAVVIGIARHKVPGMLEEPALTNKNRSLLEGFLKPLLKRVGSIDPKEKSATRREVNSILDRWQQRWKTTGGGLLYWNERRPSTTLVMSLEAVAQGKAVDPREKDAIRSVFPVPNSMRSVEPQVALRLIPRLKIKKEGDY